MPVEEKGFLFQYFDKIICLVAVIALVLSALFALKRSRGGAVKEVVDEIGRLERQIAIELQKPSSPLSSTDYVDRARKRNVVPLAAPIEDLVNYPWPRTLAPEYVGTNKTHVVKLSQEAIGGTIAPDTVRIERPTDPQQAVVLKNVSSHAEGDPCWLEVQTGEQEGETDVAFETTDGRTIIVLIRVDRRVGEKALPPLAFSVLNRRGGNVVTYRPNAANDASGVEVLKYEIHRKDLVGRAGGFRVVHEERVQEEERTRKATAPVRRTIPTPRGRGSGSRFMTLEEEEQEAILRMLTQPPTMPLGPPQPQERVPTRDVRTADHGITWTDIDVRPGEEYVYKVCTFARYSQPRRSEFTDEIQVTAPAEVDFRVTGASSSERVLTEVARHTQAGVLRGKFRNGPGDEIGGMAKTRLGTTTNLLTGAYLLDYHPRIIRSRPAVVGARIIYLDALGNVRMRWEREGVTRDLWRETGRVAEERAGVPRAPRTTPPYGRGQPPVTIRPLPGRP